MQMIDKSTVVAFFDAASDIMNEQKQYLIDLDAALGDGDLGLTMSAGFAEAKKAVGAVAEADVGKLFMAAGMAIAKAVPSTMGTLVGSGFMKVAKATKGSEALDAAAFALAAREFVTGLMERGKARPGDRTIIDAMDPAATALEQAAAGGASVADAAKAAVKAAEQGVEATKNMKAAFGRGVFFGDQVLGKPDQGAIVGWYIYQAWKKAICG